ncbi:A24 family peptidase [Vibrio hippocampi]|uniref:Prepilin type IV endopeptidase peptidase domain-containing protein n=1 Tax=Vibrio hippocampi TaxID=654686 RepID=A0ABN8DJL3_9VIBR|nr:prepilin peptidase [Vibrio hippocampi]CAH0529491.1 hypothetical protein VHP8226_03246 [Vibrio hippocampi]
MVAEQTLLVSGLVILSWVSLSDIRARIISNRLVLITLFISLLLSLISPFLLTAHIYSVLCAVALSLALYVLRVMGGGDVKLIVALSLAIPVDALAGTLLLTTLVGGALSLFYLVKYRVFKLVSVEMGESVPYGVAIAAGFGLTIFNLYI